MKIWPFSVFARYEQDIHDYRKAYWDALDRLQAISQMRHERSKKSAATKAANKAALQSDTTQRLKEGR